MKRHLRELVNAVIRTTLCKLGVKIGAIELGPGHFHPFLTGCRKYPVPEPYQHIKGFSSYQMRDNCRDMMQPHLWGDSLWPDRYFHEYPRRVTSDTVKSYVEQQQEMRWMPGNPKPRGDAGPGSKGMQVPLEMLAA